jgi:hypothetical protein
LYAKHLYLQICNQKDSFNIEAIDLIKRLTKQWPESMEIRELYDMGWYHKYLIGE